MKPTPFALAAILSAVLVPAAQAQTAKAAPPPAAPSTAPKDPAAQFGYAIGLKLGQNFKRGAVTVDPAALAQGVKDGLSGAKPLMTEDEMRAVVAQAQAGAEARREEARAAAAAANKAQAAAFLKANAAKPGVISLPSGLEYQVLKAGSGPMPKADDLVLCNYRGTLLDGTPFDSSYDRGEPASFAVSGVIKGWTEALQKMPVGSTWRLFVPADLAYGDKGAGDKIEPGAALIFDVELISIQPKG